MSTVTVILLEIEAVDLTFHLKGLELLKLFLPAGLEAISSFVLMDESGEVIM